jgi:SAM-dependent methyltransferase
MTTRTNAEAIADWSAMPDATLASFDPEGDFARRTMLNPEIFRLLGDVRGRRILDAGCGQGYLCRLLADRGADIVGVEPARGPYRYAVARERERRQGVRYHQADLARPPRLGEPFDAVVANVVFEAIPDWLPAMRACVQALRPGGLLVFSLEHPCFEDAARSWREHGCVRVHEYLHEYERPGPHGIDFHRPLSVYLNAVIGLGCHLTEISEPGLDPKLAAPEHEAAVHVPNFIVIAATRA